MFFACSKRLHRKGLRLPQGVPHAAAVQYACHLKRTVAVVLYRATKRRKKGERGFLQQATIDREVRATNTVCENDFWFGGGKFPPRWVTFARNTDCSSIWRACRRQSVYRHRFPGLRQQFDPQEMDVEKHPLSFESGVYSNPCVSPASASGARLGLFFPSKSSLFNRGAASIQRRPESSLLFASCIPRDF